MPEWSGNETEVLVAYLVCGRHEFVLLQVDVLVLTQFDAFVSDLWERDEKRQTKNHH